MELSKLDLVLIGHLRFNVLTFKMKVVFFRIIYENGSMKSCRLDDDPFPAMRFNE
jgi:hypothetical protein